MESRISTVPGNTTSVAGSGNRTSRPPFVSKNLLGDPVKDRNTRELMGKIRETPIDVAAVKKLLDAGANIDATDARGKTIYSIAMECGDKGVKAIFEAAKRNSDALMGTF